MDKLIITVAVDSNVSYPDNPNLHRVEDVKWFAEEYNRAVDAGATICHIHGVRWLEDDFQPDGRKVSRIDFEGWQEYHDKIKEHSRAIVQYGVAAARIPDKIKLMDQKPDMMSYAFNAHDEYFQPNPNKPPKEMYAVHPREELRTFLKACSGKGVKPEFECFHTGAFFNINALRKEGLIQDRGWCTLLLWPGGAWTPQTPKALMNLVDHLPGDFDFNVSVMDYDVYNNWQILTLAIMLGGHVRVGFEDNPFLEPGVYAKSNAELVEKIVKIAKALGREIASLDEARQIVFRK
ncbi:3-keto-5-aminohexanoate cleavage protein [Chloroflexota bacterium]